MFHFIKYLFLTLFCLGLVNFFLSNSDTTLVLNYKIPLILNSQSRPLSLNHIILFSFCIGILFSAFLGALRFQAVRSEKKKLKKLKEEIEEERDTLPHESSPRSSAPQKLDTLPPLAE